MLHDPNTGDNSEHTSRRRFLRTVGAGTAGSAVVSMAGCMSDDENSFTFTTGQSDSMAFAMANSLSTRLNEDSEYDLNVEAATSRQSMASLAQGETDIGYATTLVGRQVRNGEGDFGELDTEDPIYQFLSYYFIRVGLVADVESDIEYYSDLAGETFGPGPAGAGYYPPFELAIEQVLEGEEINTTNTTPSELSGLLAEGRVSAAGGPLYINGLTPSYIEQLYTENDIRLLGWEDDSIETIEAESRIPGVYVQNDDLGDGISEFTMSDETYMVSANYVAFASESISQDAAYDLLNAIWEQRDELPESHAGFEPWTQDDFWTANFTPEIPIHPGVAEFLQEKDLWNDEFEAGEF